MSADDGKATRTNGPDGRTGVALARAHERAALDVFATIAASRTASDARRMAAAVALLRHGREEAAEPAMDPAAAALAEFCSEASQRRRERMTAYYDEIWRAAMAARRDCGCTACMSDLMLPSGWGYAMDGLPCPPWMVSWAPRDYPDQDDRPEVGE